MSQPTTWGVPLLADAPVSPEAYAIRDDDSLDALLSSHSGETPPTYAVEGTVWRKPSTRATRVYDGTNWGPNISPERQAEHTIATGAITPAGPGSVPVDTEADAASDDLDTITATNLEDGDHVTLYAANDARTVVVKNGTGNIHIGADFSLDHSRDRIVLEYDSSIPGFVGISTMSNGI